MLNILIGSRLLLTILCCALLRPGAFAAGAPADAIQPGSVWRGGDGDRSTLTILERQGDTFRARFDIGNNFVREVTGPVKGNAISWLSRDVRAIKGGPGGDNFGIISGDRIDFTWHDAKTVHGKPYTLVRVGGENRPGAPTAPVDSVPASAAAAIQTDPNQPRIEVLKEQAPNASAWVLAPLDQGVPGDIRQNLTFLREDLLDESREKPKASAGAYKAGGQLCGALIAALDERDVALVRAGFRAVEANATTGVTSQALEARRNYKMSWPQYARENAQRAELKSQAINNAEVMKERPKVEWSERAAGYRKTIDALYEQFREALRPPPVK